MLRGSHRPEAQVLLTLFPPKPALGEQRGGSTYYPATVAQVLGSDAGLIAAIQADMSCRPAHSLGLVANEALPQPDGWGSQPAHFPIRRTRQGRALDTADQQDYQAERCQLWNSGRREGWCAPKQWGASAEHIGPCTHLFVECDSDEMSPAKQLLLATFIFGAEPSFSVHTGGRSLHCKYRLSTPVSPERFTALQKLVIAAYEHVEPDCKVDRSLAKANQVLRVAGGRHPRTGQLASIYSASNTLLDPAELEARLEPLLPPPPATAPPPLPSHRSRPAHSRGRYTPTLRDVADALATVPRRQPGCGGYAAHRNLLWGLVRACEEAGGSADTAIALMEAHSPSRQCGWDVAQVARSGGDQATPGWFWAQAGGHPAKRQGVRS